MNTLTLLSIPALAAVAVAQAAPVPMETRAVDVDSGYLDHLGAAPASVFRKDVTASGAAWMRLHFENTNIPEGSSLRLTARRDGAVQHFDGRSLRDYGDGSAWFNGDRVEVTLIAGPDTRGNRVHVTRIDVGLPGVAGPESICGTTDDRALSYDPRVGRAVSGASACTWWLVDEFTILTAGHCAAGASSTVIVGFNIPLSSPSGTYVQPHPDDQYPLDRASMRSLNAGVGADWAVVAALRNSNHGLYPGQRQGASFQLGPVPTAISGVDIRITGNGRVSTPVSPTWNAVQKTHVGPRANTSLSNALAYRTDTTGGNSGSPIIHEQTGEAIGIHTHGGCSRSGGQNQGTRIDRSDLATAIQTVRNSKIAGSLREFGQGCGGASLALAGIPDLGGSVTVTVRGLPAGQPGAMLLGFSDSAWAGGALPYDLGLVGLAGCTLYTEIVANEALATGTGSISYPLQVPRHAGLIDRSLFLQFLSADPARVAVTSNAGEIHVGG